VETSDDGDFIPPSKGCAFAEEVGDDRVVGDFASGDHAREPVDEQEVAPTELGLVEDQHAALDGSLRGGLIDEGKAVERQAKGLDVGIVFGFRSVAGDVEHFLWIDILAPDGKTAFDLVEPGNGEGGFAHAGAPDEQAYYMLWKDLIDDPGLLKTWGRGHG